MKAAQKDLDHNRKFENKFPKGSIKMQEIHFGKIFKKLQNLQFSAYIPE